jgi:hypothetical protein
MAWRIVQELIKHTWGEDKSFDDNDFLNICSNFVREGGFWQGLMEGDLKHISLLSNKINDFMSNRNLEKVASSIVLDGEKN